ncbi:ABC transporter A family member 8 [Sorghum bicolor]|uniref:ABC transporter A family member 8 n=1 Tax=Sorghum bicolor TaxID=4558 RepID=UPI000B42548F|nr:ABC transporter A family member 8 [Sorghum bicolor]|eukprot:XP_021321342.1 ABC transporter A family member 8 [Sorghum bicolor]
MPLPFSIVLWRSCSDRIRPGRCCLPAFRHLLYIQERGGVMQNMNAAVAEMATDDAGGRARFWTQMHALFLKNLSFQRRNARANATIAAFPVLVCVLLFGMQSLGSSTPPAHVLNVEPAFAPNETLYVLQPQCLWNSGTVSATYNELPLQYCYDFLDTSMTSLQVYISYNSTFSWDDGDDDNGDDGSMTVLRVPRLVNMASTAYLKLLLGADAKMDLDYLKEMPKPETKMTMDLTPLLDPLFFTWVVQLLLPVTVTLLVYEKEHKLRLMMKMHGLKNAPYWLITYAYFLCLSTAYITLLMIFGSLLGLDIFRLNNYGVQFIFYFTYINLQIALAFLFASFFSSTKTASVISYIYVFGSGLLADSLFVYYIQDTTFPYKWLVTMELFPAFSLYRGIYDLAGYAYAGRYLGNPGMQWTDLNDLLNGIKDVLVLMSAEWIFLIPVAFLLDHWPVWQWNPLSLYRLLSTKRSQLSGTLNEVNSKSTRVSIDMAKPDVFLERKVVERLLKKKMGKRGMVICDNLKKLYPGKNGNPDKVAVRGLSLALPRGQCFGMLGPSGSGKTSFISMMIGLQMPSYGTAYIDGMDLRKDMDEIYANIGVCPQHDLLWETLTGREHLMFYGRMKNLTGVALTKAVEESLKSVNLFHSGFGDKSASTYSGGMKRRLSAAIALIGNPKVVYMDELSTGLDPASRRYLWNAVKQAKKNCTIILTTHSMEEADELCDRVGIFVDGDFHCLGTPIELKARYGGTWILTIMTEPKHEGEVQELVNQLSPGASRIYSLSGTQKFTLPRREVGLDGVFRVVDMARRAFPVLGWGVAGATLEDVFIRVVKDAQVSDDMS